MSLRPTRRDWRFATADLSRGLASRDIWFTLGLNDIRQRYRRSTFGQFWITLSMGIFICGIGLVYSILFNQPIQDYIPYLAVNITAWTLISGTIGESCTAFTQAAVYMRQDALPKSIFIMRLLLRNLIVFSHNLVIVVLAFAAFRYLPSPVIVAAIPGLLIVFVNLFLMSLLLGVLSTRFRDLPQIIQNGLQLLFFVTPIMWRSEQMSASRQEIVLLNPFAALLRVLTEPILGRLPSGEAYGMAFLFTALLALCALPVFARFRARLVYWL